MFKSFSLFSLLLFLGCFSHVCYGGDFEQKLAKLKKVVEQKRQAAQDKIEKYPKPSEAYKEAVLAKPDNFLTKQLLTAVKKNDLAGVRLAVQAGADPFRRLLMWELDEDGNYLFSDGEKPWTVAKKGGKESIRNYFKAQKASFYFSDAESNEGYDEEGSE